MLSKVSNSDLIESMEKCLARLISWSYKQTTLGTQEKCRNAVFQQKILQRVLRVLLLFQFTILKQKDQPNIFSEFFQNILNASKIYEQLYLRKKCLYSELFWSAFFRHVSVFGLNMKRYYVSLLIQCKCGKMREKCGAE